MARRGRATSATVVVRALMMSALTRSVPAFMLRTSLPRALPAPTTAISRGTSRSARPLALAKGFGETPKPAKPQKKPSDGKAPRQARSLMPLANEASKLLVKQGADGTVKFDNPAVGDFQVLDALVEVSGVLASTHGFAIWSVDPVKVVLVVVEVHPTIIVRVVPVRTSSCWYCCRLRRTPTRSYANRVQGASLRGRCARSPGRKQNTREANREVHDDRCKLATCKCQELLRV